MILVLLLSEKFSKGNDFCDLADHSLKDPNLPGTVSSVREIMIGPDLFLCLARGFELPAAGD